MPLRRNVSPPMRSVSPSTTVAMPMTEGPHELLRRATAWESGPPEKQPGPVPDSGQLSLLLTLAKTAVQWPKVQ